MGDKEADIIVNSGVDHIKIRSVLECRAKHGACRSATVLTLPTVSLLLSVRLSVLLPLSQSVSRVHS